MKERYHRRVTNVFPALFSLKVYCEAWKQEKVGLNVFHVIPTTILNDEV